MLIALLDLDNVQQWAVSPTLRDTLRFSIRVDLISYCDGEEKDPFSPETWET